MSAVRMDHIRDIVKELIHHVDEPNSFSTIENNIQKKLSGLHKRLAERKFDSNEDGILSVSVAIASSDSDIIYKTAVGPRDILKDQEEQVDTNTLYNTGSVSKFILMILMLRLIQQGVFNFNTTIKQILPDADIPNCSFITIEHLLSHHSGLRDCDFSVLRENDPIIKLLKRNENNEPDLAGLPGERFYYANINYALIAHIIQVSMKKSLQECFRLMIGDVLHLDHTLVIDQCRSELPIAIGYKPNINLTSIQDSSDQNIFGATSFRSTPSDLAKLLTHFFNDNLFIAPQYRERVISSIHDETFEVVTKKDVYRWPVKMGLGIEKHEFNLNDDTVVLYGHGGWQDGHAAFVAYSPLHHQAYCCCVTKTQGLHLIKSPYQANSLFKSNVLDQGSRNQSVGFRSISPCNLGN